MTLSTIKPAAGHRSTKTRILDAAEELFAARGYHGVSLRDITHAAGVEVALANYHFGPKEELFRQVVTRRSAAHCEGVLGELDRVQTAARERGRVASIEDVVRAFCVFTWQKTMHGGPGWKHYFQLVSRAALSPVYEPVLAPLNRAYGVVVRRYLEAMQQALPTFQPGNLYTAFYYLQAIVILMLAETQILDRQSRGTVRAADFDAHLARIVPFVSAGLYALAGQPDPPAGLKGQPGPC